MKVFSFALPFELFALFQGCLGKPFLMFYKASITLLNLLCAQLLLSSEIGDSSEIRGSSFGLSKAPDETAKKTKRKGGKAVTLKEKKRESSQNKPAGPRGRALIQALTLVLSCLGFMPASCPQNG